MLVFYFSLAIFFCEKYSSVAALQGRMAMLCVDEDSVLVVTGNWVRFYKQIQTMKRLLSSFIARLSSGTRRR